MAKTLAAAVLVLMLCAFGTAHADLVTNGTFTSDGVDLGGFITVAPSSSTQIPGWTVTQNTVDWIGSYWTTPVGNSIDLDGTPGFGGISQTLGSLTAGQQYQSASPSRATRKADPK